MCDISTSISRVARSLHFLRPNRHKCSQVNKENKSKYKEKQRALLKIWPQKCSDLATLSIRLSSYEHWTSEEKLFFVMLLMLMSLLVRTGRRNQITDRNKKTMKCYPILKGWYSCRTQGYTTSRTRGDISSNSASERSINFIIYRKIV